MKRRLLYLSFLGLAACASQDMADLREYVAEVKARPPKKLSPIPEVKKAETFIYEAKGRRDPFTPQSTAEPQLPQAVVENGPSPDPNRPREELESYSLDSLRMVGTVEQGGETWGLVQTKDGTIHRVKVGNYMGMNHGRIIRISEEKIELMELIPKGDGGYLEKVAALAVGEK